MTRIIFALLVFLLSSVSLSLAAWDRNYIGINYKGFPQTVAEIDRDLAILGPQFGYLRTYNSLFGASSPENAIVGRVAAYNAAHPATKIKVALGVALTPQNQTLSYQELDNAIANAKKYSTTVTALVVGNENYGVDPKFSWSEAQLISFINYAKKELSGTGVPVTTCQTWGVLAGHPNLVNACSSPALANIYPYWNGPGYSGGTPNQAGVDTLTRWQRSFLECYNKLVSLYGKNKIRIGETGWPSGGQQYQFPAPDGHWTGIPNLANEQTYVEQYAVWAGAGQLFTYLFSAFDEPNKGLEPGGVQKYWGVYTETDVPKWHFAQSQAVNEGTTIGLHPDSTYDDLVFNGGTLQIMAPQTFWSNDFFTLIDTTSTLNNNGNDFTYTGNLSGGGNLTHTGTGTTTHLGNGSGFWGIYTVAAGTLNLSNTLGATDAACAVTVLSGGVLTGTGPLVGSLDNRGTVNPGNSPGTLNVVGSYSQTATAALVAEIASASNFDRINITGTPGTATLAGTFTPTLLGGFRPSRNQVFSGVITATGGLTGTFDTITSRQLSPIMAWQPRYLPNSLDLVAWADFATPGLPLNANQFKVGAMLNELNATAIGDLAGVLDTIAQLPTGVAVAGAYQQISPDKASALPALSLAGSMMQWQSVANRLSYQRWRQGGLPNLAAGRSESFNLSYNSLAGLLLAYNGSDLTGLVNAPRPQADSAGTWGVFTDFVSSFGTQDTTATSTGYNFSIFGFTVGADYRFRDDLVFGLGTGYYNTSASYKGSGGDAAIGSIPFYAYGAYTPGSFYAMGYLGYTLNLYSLNRNLAFGGLNRVATGSPNGNQLNASLETGYDLKLAKFTVTPALSVYYSTAWVDSFTEDGAGALNLKVGAQSADSVQTGIGLRLSRPFQSGTTILLPQIFAFYQHEFADNSRGLDARLAQTGNPFAFQTDSPSRNFALLGAGLAAGLSRNLTLRASYNAEVGRGGYTPHVVSAGLRYEF